MPPGNGDRAPMLATQRALWKLRFRLPDPSPLHLAFGLLLDGPLDRVAMEWTFQELVRRHEPLRTLYSGSEKCPKCEILPDATVDFQYEDVSELLGRDRACKLLESFANARHSLIDE